MQSEPEVLEHEAPRPVPRAVWLSLALVLLLGGVAWAVDEHRRGQENSALADCRAQLLAADQAATSRLGRVADYLRPTLATLPLEVARRLAGPMESPARLALPRVRAAVATCRDVHVWSWHEPTRGRREAALAYGDRLLERLEQVAVAGEAYFFEPDDRLDQLRALADLS